MLKKRIITGLILAVIVLSVVFLAHNVFFAWATAAFFLLGAWEWACLSGLKNIIHRAIYVIAMALVFLLCWYLSVFLVVLVACVFWLVALFFVIKFPKKQAVWSKLRFLIGAFVLAPSWLAINVLHASQHGLYLILSLFFLVWSADIGAYFAGKFWGKHKMMPRVSPGKTWEGFAGGLLLSMLLASILSSWLPNLTVTEWFIMLLSVVLLNIYAVTGDLFESMIKRYCQVKDSGKMLPGHGGILDRIDSLCAAAPIFLLGLIAFMYW